MGAWCGKEDQRSRVYAEAAAGGGHALPQALPRAHSDLAFCVARAGPGTRTVSGGEGRRVVEYGWEDGAGGVRAAWEGHKRCVNAVVASADGAAVFSASRDKTVRGWGAAGAAAVLEGHTQSVSAVGLSHDGAALCSGSRDYSVRFWDVAPGGACGREVSRREAQRNVVTALRWFPGAGSTRVAQCGEDLVTRVWDARDRRPAAVLPRRDHFALACDVSDDGLALVTAENGFDSDGCGVAVWDLRAASAPARELRAHTQAVRACRLLPAACGGGGRAVLSASKDRTLALWGADGADPLAVGELAGSMSFSGLSEVGGDGRVYASSDSGALSCWRASVSGDGVASLALEAHTQGGA